MPTDPYHTVAHVSPEDIVGRVALPAVVPEIFLLVGPCRSGTTAQAKVFRAAGMLAHHQPLKSVLRCLLQGQQETYTLPQVPQLCLRETLGPYTRAEATLDPLALLLQAGVPGAKVRVILMLREPLSTLTSWKETFAQGRESAILVHNCIAAYQTMQRIQEQALSAGLPVLHYVYEALRDTDPASLSQRLFARLGLNLVYRELDWNRLAPFASTDEHPSLPGEPACYLLPGLPGLQQRETEASGLAYTARSAVAIDQALTWQDVVAMSEAGIPALYERFRIQTEHDLGLTLKSSQEISEYHRRSAEKS
ncbi:MAG TPA: hypothetical protein VGF67_01510 [Ktedonobacteraceae bacterium]|jgi:hypothetical protein